MLTTSRTNETAKANEQTTTATSERKKTGVTARRILAQNDAELTARAGNGAFGGRVAQMVRRLNPGGAPASSGVRRDWRAALAQPTAADEQVELGAAAAAQGVGAASGFFANVAPLIIKDDDDEMLEVSTDNQDRLDPRWGRFSK